MKRWLAALMGVLAAVPAAAQDEEPRFCPDRPSLGSSTCTTDPGRVLVEISVLDWQRDDRSDEREDQLLATDLFARVGVGPRTEVQVGWTAFGHVRTRDKLAEGADTVNGVGDVRLGLRQNLQGPDGKGLSFAIEPFVTLPIGRTPIGDTSWSAGVVLPVSYDLSDSVNLSVTGQVAAQANEESKGRHLEASAVVGLGVKLSEQVTWVSELSLERDDEPIGAETQWLAAQSIAWQPTQGLQLDLLGVAGLNRNAPDVRVAIGGAVLF